MIKMRKMHNPPHPGLTLRDDILPALGITVTAAAEQLGVTRAALSRVLNAKAAIPPEMALRIEAWLGIENGGNASVWLGQQSAYDLWKARKTIKRPKVKHVQIPDLLTA
jgi:addiction module HigA family antidote